MIDYDYIVKVLKQKGFKLNQIAEILEIQYQTLRKNLKSGNGLEMTQRIALATNINFIEFLIPPDSFAHFYEPTSGEWLGIRKK